MPALLALVPVGAAAAAGAGGAAAAGGAAVAAGGAAAATAGAGAATAAAATSAAATGITLSQALAVASLAASIGGGVLAAQGQSNQADAIAQASAFNASQIEEQARQQSEAAGLRAQERRRLAKEAGSTQQALLAADGADTTAGQPLLLQTELASEGEFQAQLEQFQGDRTAETLKTKASFERLTGQQESSRIKKSAGTTLLTRSLATGANQARFF
jgi:hypothetical protein